eukprot:gnl/TRDRNA2_/TRDRNA2_146590_c1_seq1.p1 gnl/TRDRNA2_/TRDRNA2_146590_c1~~gnl/TRDRNA2_/TRDRNA2_146590_c1_seq1.p1  ORF type:complete len:117 (+),score=20.79 gnl/TRDRNA2_/TRDRNA2_146590_c1_seq1:32-352(+)
MIDFDDFFHGTMLVMKGRETARAKDLVGTNLLAGIIATNMQNADSNYKSIVDDQRNFDRGVRLARMACKNAEQDASRVADRLDELTAEVCEIRKLWMERERTGRVS